VLIGISSQLSRCDSLSAAYAPVNRLQCLSNFYSPIFIARQHAMQIGQTAGFAITMSRSATLLWQIRQFARPSHCGIDCV